jgi:hypothetical protein
MVLSSRFVQRVDSKLSLKGRLDLVLFQDCVANATGHGKSIELRIPGFSLMTFVVLSFVLSTD